MKLNPEQTMASEHLSGPCIVTSVPGSGKTASITARVVNLIKNGVSPNKILCLTFTNKAANEMRERISKNVKENDEIWIGTFHALCLFILKKYGNHIGLQSNFSIYDSADQIDLVKRISRMHELEDYPNEAVAALSRVINDFRENIGSLDDYGSELSMAEKEVANEYLKLLDVHNAVDFSGILYKTYQLFKSSNHVQSEVSSLFSHVMVDEMQDTNKIQYELIKYIASHGNIFVVADVNQSIFSWRGARPENINKIKKDFDNVQEITLPRNYRSTKDILKMSQNLIRHNDNAKHVEIISERGDGNSVCISEQNNPETEADSIVRTMDFLIRKHGYNWKDFAVLYRVNYMSKTPEMAFRNASIPYKIVGGFSFFDRKEIKTALAYLSFFQNNYDSIAFARLVSSPKRHISDTTIGRLDRLSQKKGISILDACKISDEIPGISKVALKNISSLISVFDKYKQHHASGMSLVSVVDGLLKDSGYYSYVYESGKKDDSESKRVENVKELLNSIADYSKKKPNATIDDYLHSVQIMATMVEEDEEDCVKLLTMHSSKGLEFPVVFIIGAEQNIIPHRSSVIEGREDEERRLMYVAMTRAKDYLFVSYCKYRKSFILNSGQKQFICKPSLFLREMSDPC